MAFPSFRFHSGGLHLPDLGLWLDPHEPCLGPEKVFVSHAHSDHVASHREVILSAPTARLMQARVPGSRLERVLNFREPAVFEHGSVSCELTLFPAGHIFGSAMARILAGGQTFLYTGDFKLRHGLSAEPCEPQPADILVMETTFGRPQYRFPPTEAVINGVIKFCREALDNDETAVLFGYSLGKSQELLCALGAAGLPIMLHGAIYRLTRIYEQFGHCFPPFEKYEPDAARGKILLCPPHVANSPMLRRLGKTRSAILTGWAVDPNCRYRYQCDAAFPLSDHADFPDLLDMVRQVRPKRVYTLHGFAADFALALRELGYDAQALSQDEQFLLPLGQSTMQRRVAHTRPPTARVDANDQSSGLRPVALDPGGHAAGRCGPHLGSQPLNPPLSTPSRFHEFALTCVRVGADKRKLEKIRLLAEFFTTLNGGALVLAATWFSGRPFPLSQNKVLQLGWAVLRGTLRSVAGVDEQTFYQVYLKHSDLGDTLAELLADCTAQPTLSIGQVGELFEQLHAARGPLAKTQLLEDALRSCTAVEAKYIVKIITGDLRIGLKEGLVEEAIASAFGQSADDVRNANLLLGDVGQTAALAAENRLKEATILPFRPLKLMLASPEETPAGIWRRVQAWAVDPGKARGSPCRGAEGRAGVSSDRNLQVPPARPSPPAAQVWIEDKYDGIRCQLHKAKGRVALYSRDLKDITSTFRELADAASELRVDAILDGEIVAMRGEEVLPFVELQKRLGRKEDDLFMREEVPIRFVAFDLLWREGVDLLQLPLWQRRAVLEELAPLPAGFALARISPAQSVEGIDAAFAAARERGNEGLMVKDPSSAYAPGRRGLAWLKLKRPLATLDCVVVGAEYGHGKRSKVLSDYTFAVRDEATGELKTIGKAYTGLTDPEIEQLTAKFLRNARQQSGRYFDVPPDTVLEIAFDRVQPSTRHSSGLALRFPRIVRIRMDKTVADIDTLQTARRLVPSRGKSA